MAVTSVTAFFWRAISLKTMTELMESNIKKNYVFSFLMNFRLSNGLWMIYMASRGMSLTQIGFLEGIFHVTSLMMEVPTGSVADLFGRKLSRSIGRCLSLVSILVLIGATSFFHFTIFMVLAALSYNLESGSGEALVYDSLKYLKAENNFISVLGRQEAIFQVSSVVALLIGGFLGTYSYHYAFWASSGIIAFSVVYSLSFTEPPILESVGRNSKTFRGFLKQIVDSFSLIARDRKVAFLIFFVQTILAFSACIFFYIQNYWKGLGRTEFQIGIYLAAGSFLAGLVAMKVQRLSHLLKEIKVLIILPLISVASMWGVALCSNKLPFFMVVAMIEAMLFVAGNDYINKLIPSRSRATIISFASMMYSLVMIIFFPIFGRIADTISFGVAFVSLAVMASCLYVLSMYLLKKIG